VRGADFVHQGKHLVQYDRLDDELKDVPDELITLSVHLLLEIVHVGLLLNLLFRHFIFALFERLNFNFTLLLKLVEQFTTLRELNLTD